jgi:hypothetical protein
LLACTNEVVLVANGLSKYTFPRSLMYYKITPLNMFRVIETYVKTHINNLPVPLKSHLKWCEDYILLTSSWKQGQEIFTLLKEYSANVQLERYTYKMNKQNIPKTTLPSLLNSFLNKIERIASVRLLIILKSLMNNDNNDTNADATTTMTNTIWTMVLYVITNKWWLLQNRHIDHILLCSIYSIFKSVPEDGTSSLITTTSANNKTTTVTYKKSMTFENIVDCYCNIIDFIWYPAASNDRKGAEFALSLQSNVLFRVPMTLYASPLLASTQPKLLSSPPTDDLFTFYNTIFLPTMQSYTLEFNKDPKTIVCPSLVNIISSNTAFQGTDSNTTNTTNTNKEENMNAGILMEAVAVATEAGMTRRTKPSNETLALIRKTRAQWGEK